MPFSGTFTRTISKTLSECRLGEVFLTNHDENKCPIEGNPLKTLRKGENAYGFQDEIIENNSSWYVDKIELQEYKEKLRDGWNERKKKLAASQTLEEMLKHSSETAKNTWLIGYPP